MFKGLFGGGYNKTLKRNKEKTFDEGTAKYEKHKYAKTTLSIADLKTAVLCPEDELLNDWLAVHVHDFYNTTMMMNALIDEECKRQNLDMTAGDRFKYLWADEDSVDYKKPTKVTAALYCDLLFAWVERQLEDPNKFPKNGEYGEAFMSSVKHIFKRLFRVYAHLYYHHFEYICHIGADAHVNTCFKHFILFAKHYSLIPEKELAPLADLIHNLIHNHDDDDMEGED